MPKVRAFGIDMPTILAETKTSPQTAFAQAQASKTKGLKPDTRSLQWP
jgi:hypothetical protein